MKPLKLVMCAFGPFAEEVTIDFEMIGKTGLYLVTGDTGAGKTTIFDGISYALYGITSGELREGKMLRSKYSAASTTTFVELTFESQGKIYVVKRAPEQMRAKKRGQGEKIESEDVSLYFPDGRQSLNKVKEVNKAICEIVGLNYKQFSQITMLPQGEFRKLLIAPTEEKQIIFREIFGTEEYDCFQESIRIQCQEMAKEYDRQKSEIFRELQMLTWEDHYQDASELKLFLEKGYLVGKQEILSNVEQLVREDAALLSDYDMQGKKIGGILQRLDKRIGVATKRKESVSQLEQEEREWEKMKARLPQLEQNLKEAEENLMPVEQLTEKVLLMEGKLGDYSKCRQLQTLVEEKTKHLHTLKTKQVRQEENLEKRYKEVNAFQQLLEDNGNIDLQRMECEKLLEQFQQRMQDMHILSQNIREGKDLQRDCDHKQEEYRKKSQEVEKLAHNYARMEQLFWDGQAGILAQNLQAGKPCPVCGSLQHPEPAEVVNEVADKQELDEAKSNLEQEREQRMMLLEEFTKLKEKYSQNQEKCANICENLFGTADVKEQALQDYLVQTGNLIKEKNALKEHLRLVKTECDKAQLQIPKLQNEIKDLEAKGQSILQEQVELKKDLEHWSLQLSEMYSGLQFSDENAAQLEIKKIREDVKKRVQEQKKAMDALQNQKQQISAKEGVCTSLKHLLEQQKVEDLVELNRQRMVCSQEKENLEQTKAQVYVRHQTNRTVLERVTHLWDDFEKYEQEYIVAKRLSDTMNGELTGQEKIKLETYILMSYFERVLQKANVRLLGMTGGQYELVRSRQAVNQRSKTGLDLNVYDHYTATERPVKSLSGGETFMASLALALGLADEIQSSAGGVQMDTMFVDEGFGSLDEDTLKRAMEQLQLLTEGNRLVGVISHVKDLKRWIDRQIIVNKVPHAGSWVEIVY